MQSNNPLKKKNALDASPAYTEVSWSVVGALAFFVVIWFLQIGERREIFGAIRLEALVAAFLLVSSIFVFFSHRETEQVSSGLVPYVVIFFMVLLLHVILSHDVDTSWHVFLNRLVKFSCMAIFFSILIKNPKQLRFVIGAFLLANLYVTFESFRSALNGSMIWENQGIPRLHGNTSLFRHPNSLGGLAVGALPFVWFLLPVVSKKWAKGGLLALGIFSLGVILYTGSRTSYVAILFFAVFLFLKSRKKILVLIGLLGFAAVAPSVVPVEYKKRFETIFTGKEIEGASMSARRLILTDAWEVFKAYPLGVGVAAFPTVRKKMFGRRQDTHNLYFEVATNIGIHGLIIFFLFVFKILQTFSHLRTSFDSQIDRVQTKLSAKKDKKKQKPDGRLLDHLSDLQFLRAVSLAGLGYIFVRLILGLFGMDLYEIYWWIGLGLAISLSRINQTTVKRTEKLAGAEA